MKAPDPQPDLPALAQPRELTVGGNQLSDTLASIRERGGIVEAADVHGTSYTLQVRWPSAFQGEPCACDLCRDVTGEPPTDAVTATVGAGPAVPAPPVQGFFYTARHAAYF